MLFGGSFILPVCDMETGAAYGLCNAYCEAMDCELSNDSDPGTEPKASATACSKVRTKFQNITGHDVPCEVSCPCTTLPQFNATLASATSCVDFGFAVIVAYGDAVPIPPFFSQLAASSVPEEPDPTCGYFNIETQTGISLPITQEQAAVCIQTIRDAATSRGLTCQPF
jgi:hypothetical protein